MTWWFMKYVDGVRRQGKPVRADERMSIGGDPYITMEAPTTEVETQGFRGVFIVEAASGVDAMLKCRGLGSQGGHCVAQEIPEGTIVHVPDLFRNRKLTYSQAEALDALVRAAQAEEDE